METDAVLQASYNGQCRGHSLRARSAKVAREHQLVWAWAAEHAADEM